MNAATFRRLNAIELVEEALTRRECALLTNGALCARTGQFTGRSPKDKYFVDCPGCSFPREQHQWLSEVQFEQLYQKVTSHLEQTGGYVFDGIVNQHENYRVPIRFYTEFAWHNLFVQRLFLTGGREVTPQYTVYSAPTLRADPTRDGTRTETFIVVHAGRGIVLVGGTEYAGELKKSIFTLMHHHLAEEDIMPMHCSASVGAKGDVALFFGLSGTGKTTLSADPNRLLIGDDEHGWADDGVFNMEGGCYAKCVGLTREEEPDIFDAVRFGAVLENVVYDKDRNPLFADHSLTENTRVAYPLSFIRNHERSGRGGHPNVVIFLSADASGVLPAVSRLNPGDVRRHFLLGYTSKLAGTERGVLSPESTFSACFGLPFLTDRPSRYAHMFMQRILKHQVPVYLLSTGWVGAGYGHTQRMPLDLTRTLVQLIVGGELNTSDSIHDDLLHLSRLVHVPGIPHEFLHPERAFRSPEEYRKRRQALGDDFQRVLRPFEQRVM